MTAINGESTSTQNSFKIRDSFEKSGPSALFAKVTAAVTISPKNMDMLHEVLSHIPVLGTVYGIIHAYDALKNRDIKKVSGMEIFKIVAEILSLKIVYTAFIGGQMAVKKISSAIELNRSESQENLGDNDDNISASKTNSKGDDSSSSDEIGDTSKEV